jgi:nucleoside 2-deoxyribosyltransferase
MKVFIAGIMQGSRLDSLIDDQDYRRAIASVVLQRFPGAEIVDPNEIHPEGVSYGDEQAKVTLLAMAGLASQADLVVAYVPRASMGTAIEMWQAYQAGIPLVTISPMGANWVVKFLSDAVLPDLEAFAAWSATGALEQLFVDRGL